MRERFQRFMMGRYGMDAFSKFLMIVWIILWGIDIFVNSVILSLLSLGLLFYMYYRMFSRNIQKRYQENVKYLNIKNQIVSKFRSEKSLMNQRKTHHIYKCPTCKQKIRIPKGKGRICITCPKCKTEFTKIS
ncbi:MAG: hypothetical protein IJE23_03725 [Tyzzerella sp.]|nr:hypothetical protein [Tyzzerella sp.]